MKLVDVVNPLSFVTVSVMVDWLPKPINPLTGVIVTVRNAPLPPKTILADGTIEVSLDTAVIVNASAGVMLSPTIKARSDVIELAVTVTSSMAEMVGGVATVTVK